MNFLRNLLATIIGFFIAIFLLIVLFIGIGAIIGSDEEIIVKSNSILELDLSSEIKDYAPKDNSPFAQAFDFSDGKLGLNTILNKLRYSTNASYQKKVSRL